MFGRKDLQGGGPMIDIGVHVVEMAHYFMGSPKPVAATGNCWTYLGDKPSEVMSRWPNWDYKTYPVEDLAIGHIRVGLRRAGLEQGLDLPVRPQASELG